MEIEACIYCQSRADSLEHPLPAAFGEFRGAPHLEARICRECNNRLGLLDEQLARCGPEAFLRRFYGVEGRTTHDRVNPFYRGSAGGHRMEILSHDPDLGIDVLFECSNGAFRQLRQIIVVDKSGTPKHLPIREGMSPEQLRAAFQDLNVSDPVDVRYFFDPTDEQWALDLIKKAWPGVDIQDPVASRAEYKGATISFNLTSRYFRAVAKIGFHYFLTQFPEYTGHEKLFAGIRGFILNENSEIDQANSFVGKREHPLLSQMLDPRVRPNGWCAHILCAETIPGQCLAYVQTFVSKDWSAPTYAVYLARDNSVINSRAVGHAYVYDEEGGKGGFVGEASTLETQRYNWTPPPFSPVVKPK